MNDSDDTPFSRSDIEDHVGPLHDGSWPSLLDAVPGEGRPRPRARYDDDDDDAAGKGNAAGYSLKALCADMPSVHKLHTAGTLVRRYLDSEASPSPLALAGVQRWLLQILRADDDEDTTPATVDLALGTLERIAKFLRAPEPVVGGQVPPTSVMPRSVLTLSGRLLIAAPDMLHHLCAARPNVVDGLLSYRRLGGGRLKIEGDDSQVAAAALGTSWGRCETSRQLAEDVARLQRLVVDRDLHAFCVPEGDVSEGPARSVRRGVQAVRRRFPSSVVGSSLCVELPLGAGDFAVSAIGEPPTDPSTRLLIHPVALRAAPDDCDWTQVLLAPCFADELFVGDAALLGEWVDASRAVELGVEPSTIADPTPFRLPGSGIALRLSSAPSGMHGDVDDLWLVERT
jgi:hypothetical protein